MTKAKEPKNPGCAPKLWKRFSVYEKNLWTLFYKAFQRGEIYPDRKNGTVDSKKEREVIAHNMALHAIWTLRERNNALGKKNPYEMLMQFAAKIDSYTPEMRRLFDRLAFVLFQEYVVCGELAIKGVDAKIRLYEWKK